MSYPTSHDIVEQNSEIWKRKRSRKWVSVSCEAADLVKAGIFLVLTSETRLLMNNLGSWTRCIMSYSLMKIKSNDNQDAGERRTSIVRIKLDSSKLTFQQSALPWQLNKSRRSADNRAGQPWITAKSSHSRLENELSSTPSLSLNQGLVILTVASWVRGFLHGFLASLTTNGVKLELWVSWLGQILLLLNAQLQGSTGVLVLSSAIYEPAFTTSFAGWFRGHGAKD